MANTEDNKALMDLTSDASHRDDTSFSLVKGGPSYQIQQIVGLIPRSGLGVPRRVLCFVLLTWVPLMLWAIVTRRVFAGVASEPLLQHFGVHVRCLVAIPLFIAAEAVAEAVSQRLFPYFVTSGLVTESARSRFVDILRAAARMRDSWLAWSILVALTLLLTWYFSGEDKAVHEDALSWAVSQESAQPRLGFGGWWFLLVVRPVFTFFILHWVWRLVVVAMLSWHIARLDLRLVPTHPDRVGGLGFLELVPFAFTPIVLAISAVMASHWAHQILYHQLHVTALKVLFGAFLAAMVVIFLGPLLLYSSPLRRLKRRSLLEYGALVGQHGWLVQKRWILGEPVDDKGLLDAPELGPVADTIAMYEAVKRIKSVPLGKESLIAVVVPVLLPMIPVLAIEVPLKETLLKLLGALI